MQIMLLTFKSHRHIQMDKFNDDLSITWIYFLYIILRPSLGRSILSLFQYTFIPSSKIIGLLIIISKYVKFTFGTTQKSECIFLSRSPIYSHLEIPVSVFSSNAHCLWFTNAYVDLSRSILLTIKKKIS